MKKLTCTLFFCFLFMNAHADCEIMIRVTEYPPQYFQENGQWKGLAIELAEALLGETDCKPVYRMQPWKRALESMRTGIIDMQLNLSITDERKEFMYFIGPQRDESMILAVAEDSNYEINSLEDIKKLPGRIGIQQGAYYGDEFKTKFEKDKVFARHFYSVTNAKQLALMFREKRIIGFAIDQYELFHKTKTIDIFKGLKAHQFIINQNFVYFGLSKKSVSSQLLDKLNKAYDSARAKGKFEKVLKRYK